MYKVHEISGGSQVTLLDIMGSDLTVINSAKVSFHKQDTEVTDNNYGLLEYLAKHNHWSPFAHCTIQWRIKAPIFVARQLVKHQIGLVWNEVSRRYVSDDPEFYIPESWRGKPTGGAKQGSSGVIPLDHKITVCDSVESFQIEADNAFHLFIDGAVNLYRAMLDAGIAPEQARMVLPQNMMTEWIWTGSLYAFARVCKLRLDPHAQQESRDIAKVFDMELQKAFPYSWNYLMEYMKV
jgi:thymidylate synthase (FAD)